MNADTLTLPTEMLPTLTLPAEAADDCLETLMQRRLGNRVRDLRVLRLPAGLIIQGRTNTYYAKQLATHAAMEFADEPIAANEIEVL